MPPSGPTISSSFASYATCSASGQPEPAKADTSLNAYVFEHPVLFDDGFGHTTTKFIDLYKRGCFILEAKQGSDQECRPGPFRLETAEEEPQRDGGSRHAGLG